MFVFPKIFINLDFQQIHGFKDKSSRPWVVCSCFVFSGPQLKLYYSAFENNSPTTLIRQFLEIFKMIFGQKNRNCSSFPSGSSYLAILKISIFGRKLF